MNKYKIPQPKPRMSAFNRFKKYVVSPVIDEVLTEAGIPPNMKLSAISTAASAAWNHFVIHPLYNKYGVNDEKQGAKLKKKLATEIDYAVNDFIGHLNNDPDFVNALKQNLAESIEHYEPQE